MQLNQLLLAIVFQIPGWITTTIFQKSSFNFFIFLVFGFSTLAVIWNSLVMKVIDKNQLDLALVVLLGFVLHLC